MRRFRMAGRKSLRLAKQSRRLAYLEDQANKNLLYQREAEQMLRAYERNIKQFKCIITIDKPVLNRLADRVGDFVFSKLRDQLASELANNLRLERTDIANDGSTMFSVSVDIHYNDLNSG